VIAPHAGYVYSGPVAASAFARLKGAEIARVVLLGPAHYAWVRGVAAPEAEAFETPLGVLRIESAGLPRDRRSHEKEHSLEVEVPFLQVLLKEFRLVPLVVDDPEAARDALGRLWGGAETLIVISSDLSHYLPYEWALKADQKTAEKIVALQTVGSDEACGSAAVNGFLEAARKKKLRAELIDLRNSGDTAGDKARVVGYGAFAFYQ
jgi:AmmeMemoRadiSam system protein B